MNEILMDDHNNGNGFTLKVLLKLMGKDETAISVQSAVLMVHNMMNNDNRFL